MLGSRVNVILVVLSLLFAWLACTLISLCLAAALLSLNYKAALDLLKWIYNCIRELIHTKTDEKTDVEP